MTPPPRVFVSYARADGEPFAEELVRLISGAGIPVWIDRDGLRGGRGWWDQIDHVISQVEFMVAVMTPAAVESEVVRKEWHAARERGVCVFPVIASAKLPWKAMPLWMRRGHCYDLDHQKQRFLNDLNTRCEKVRVPFMVTNMSKDYVARPALFGKLIEQLVDNTPARKPVTVALRGGGGFGKSTLARALCHDVRIRYAFHHGILWVTLGEESLNLAPRVEDMVYQLSGERPGFVDATDASHRLRELLRDRNVLIVVDDVWRESDASPFLVGGEDCAHLLTTRIRGTLPKDCIEVPVNEMESEEALQVLSAGIPSHDIQRDLQLLAEFLGSWPILMNLVNRIMVDRVARRNEDPAEAIRYANSRLDYYGLTAFDRRDSNARNDAVAKTVAVSLDLLRETPSSAVTDPVARFEDLAVFPRALDIPISAVKRLWGYDKLLTEDLCDQLFNYSLLQSYDLPRGTIRVHDIILSYLRTKAGKGLSTLHTRLVASYKTTAGPQWDRPVKDDYFYERLSSHMFEARLYEDLYAIINGTWRRVQEKRDDSSRAFVNDIRLALDGALKEFNVAQLVRCCYVHASVSATAAPVPAPALAGLARLGSVEIACDKAALISDPRDRAQAYAAIATALDATDRMKSGEIFGRAVLAGKTIRSPRKRCLFFTALTRSLVASGRTAEAIEASRACADAAGVDPWDRIRAADMKLLVDDKAGAAALMKDAVKLLDFRSVTAEAVRDREPAVFVTAWLAMVDILRRAGENELADKVEASARPTFRAGPTTLREDGVTVVRFYATLDLIETLTRLDEVELALTYQSDWLRDRAAVLCTIARVLRERGHEERANELYGEAVTAWKKESGRFCYFSNYESDYARPDAASTVTQVLLDAGEFSAVVERAETLDKATVKAVILGLAGEAAAASGRMDDAKRLLQRSLDAAALPHRLPAATLLRFRTALLRNLQPKRVSGRVESWMAECEQWIDEKGTNKRLDEAVEFSMAIASFDANAAGRLCKKALEPSARNAPASKAAFASTLATLNLPDAVKWADEALQEIPSTSIDEKESFPALETLARSASAFATLSDNVRAGELVNRILDFFATREGNKRSSDELAVWDSVLRTLVAIGRDQEVIAISEHIDLWCPDVLRSKVVLLLDIARSVAGTHPELSRNLSLAAARTALTLGQFVPENERLSQPGAATPLLSTLLDQAQAAVPKLRGLLLTGPRTPFEAVLLQVDAAAALTSFDARSALALAENALQVIEPIVTEKCLFPVHSDEVGEVRQMISLILQQVLIAARVVDDPDRTARIVENASDWVAENGREYGMVGMPAAWFFLAAARAFWGQDHKSSGAMVMALALLATRTTTPDSVLELAAAGAEILSGLDEGETLAEIVELIDKTDAWLAT